MVMASSTFTSASQLLTATIIAFYFNEFWTKLGTTIGKKTTSLELWIIHHKFTPERTYDLLFQRLTDAGKSLLFHLWCDTFEKKGELPEKFWKDLKSYEFDYDCKGSYLAVVPSLKTFYLGIANSETKSLNIPTSIRQLIKTSLGIDTDKASVSGLGRRLIDHLSVADDGTFFHQKLKSSGASVTFVSCLFQTPDEDDSNFLGVATETGLLHLFEFLALAPISLTKPRYEQKINLWYKELSPNHKLFSTVSAQEAAASRALNPLKLTNPLNVEPGGCANLFGQSLDSYLTGFVTRTLSSTNRLKDAQDSRILCLRGEKGWALGGRNLPLSPAFCSEHQDQYGKECGIFIALSKQTLIAVTSKIATDHPESPLIEPKPLLEPDDDFQDYIGVLVIFEKMDSQGRKVVHGECIHFEERYISNPVYDQGRYDYTRRYILKSFGPLLQAKIEKKLAEEAKLVKDVKEKEDEEKDRDSEEEGES